MAVLNYIYLKLKMPRPCGIITTSASIKIAYTCERANYKLISMMVSLQEHDLDDHGGKTDASSSAMNITKRVWIKA